MLESKETGIIANIVDAKSGYWKPISNNKVDLFKKTLDSFFPNGINYKNEILIGRSFTQNNSLVDIKIGQFERDSQRKCKIVLDFTKNPDVIGDARIFNDSADIFVLSNLTKETPEITANSDYVFEGVVTDYTSQNNIVSFTFFLPEDLSFWINNGYTISISAPGEINYWTAEQYYINDTLNTFYPQSYNSSPYLDCSDFCSFMWQIQKGIVIKQKMFTCQDLINGSKDFIESSKLVLSDKKIVGYESLDEIMLDSEPGDIFVAKSVNDYHSLFLIDNKNSDYTECSGYVEYFLGHEYNGKLNPYPFKSRILNLSENAEVYRVRLV